jgi:hypothetical protein
MTLGSHQTSIGKTQVHITPRRTETDWFEPIWESATAILFMADRLSFFRPDGTRQPTNSGAPPVLVAFGSNDAERLKASGIPGAFVPNNWTRRPPKARSRQADLFDGSAP